MTKKKTDLDQLRALILQHPGASLEQIARLLGRERHCIERHVRVATGLSYRRHRLSILMGQAADELCHTIDPVKVIADRLGYGVGSSRNFVAAFKRCFNVSPTAFRQRHRGTR